MSGDDCDVISLSVFWADVIFNCDDDGDDERAFILSDDDDDDDDDGVENELAVLKHDSTKTAQLILRDFKCMFTFCCNLFKHEMSLWL